MEEDEANSGPVSDLLILVDAKKEVEPNWVTVVM